MRSRFYLRVLSLAAFIPVLGMVAVRPVAAQNDSIRPDLNNRKTSDCLGNLTASLSVTTATPNFQIDIQDLGSSASGVRFGRSPHLGGAHARAQTKFLMHFDESSLTFVDSTTFSNNATAGNNPTPPSSCAGTGFSGTGDCVDFDSGGDYIRIIKSASLNDTTSQITMQAWINPDTLPGVAGVPIIEFNDVSGTGAGVHLWHSVGQSGSVYANLVGTSGASNVIASTGGYVNTGTWQLVTLSWGGSGMQLYFNDVMVASGSLSGSEPLDVGKDMYIGHRPSGGTVTYDGQIDEVRILRAGLTAEDVAADYYSGTFQVTTSSHPTGVEYQRTTNLNAGHLVTGSFTNGTVSPVTMRVSNVPLSPSGQNTIKWIYQDMSGNTAFTTASMNITEVAPSIPGTPQATVNGTTALNWSWTAPSQICLASGGGAASYDVVNEAVAVQNGGEANRTDLLFAETGLAINTAVRRRIRAVDAFGNGVLSGETTAYTEAAVPTGLATASISTGSAVISWANASNPGHTRYEVGLSSDNFVNFFATAAAISDNHTALTVGVSNLEANTSYNIRVRAKNGRDSDNFGNTLTTYLTGTVSTLASGPTSLSGGPLGVSSIAWTWSAVPTATSYRLENSDTNVAIAVQAGTSFNQIGLGPNVTVNAKLRADNASGVGLFGGIVSAITHAYPPAGTALVSAGSSTVSISWTAGGNPAGTIFQAIISTSASFQVVTQTISVVGSAGSFTNLLPGTDYAFKIRAINNGGIPSDFHTTILAQTSQSVGISSQATPSSPYSSISGSAAIYHFDESSGTATIDSSGQGNHATLTCQFVNCSTPTFNSGMSGLGSAVRFTGIQDTFCKIPSKASLETTGNLTVSAWVNPDTLNQIAGAGIVVKGSGTLENFALEITAAREWQFRMRDSGLTTFTLKSTMTIVPNKWTHVAAVFKGGGGNTIHLYVDGVQTSSASIGGTGVRFADKHELTIGNRKNLPTGPYNRGFRGDIDEVQIQTRVLTAAEILTAYSGAFPAQFTPPSPNGDKRLIIPPDTFGQQAIILISGEPATSPIQINGQILTDGLASPPTGQTFVPGSVIEVVANVNGSAFTSTLNSSVTVSIPYPDTDNNLLVDGTSPPLPAQNIVMYTLNEAVVRWEPLPTTVDTVNKRVNGITSHFSIFALFAPTGIQADVSTVRVYPNPWKPGSGSHFDSVTFGGKTGLAFDNLSTSGSISIFTLSGEKVVTVSFGAGSVGTAIWDGRNSNGVSVASGVYFAYVKSNSGDVAIKKFAIQR